MSAVWVVLVGEYIALIYFELFAQFTFQWYDGKDLFVHTKTCDTMWCLKVVNVLPVIKYHNILNVLMVQGDGVACGYALHTRFVRVR